MHPIFCVNEERSFLFKGRANAVSVSICFSGRVGHTRQIDGWRDKRPGHERDRTKRGPASNVLPNVHQPKCIKSENAKSIPQENNPVIVFHLRVTAQFKANTIVFPSPNYWALYYFLYFDLRNWTFRGLSKAAGRHSLGQISFLFGVLTLQGNLQGVF